AALIGNPFIAVYRLSKFSYAVARRLVDVPHVAMVNLIAGKRIVPELIQEEFTAENVAHALRPLLEETADRSQAVKELEGVRRTLRWEMEADGSSSRMRLENPTEASSASVPARTAIDRAAAWVLRFLDREHRDSTQPRNGSRIPDIHG
ncbi:MAG: hypothetical protein ACYCPD_16750, partial [Acidobacteriaceae bacterium]